MYGVNHKNSTMESGLVSLVSSLGLPEVSDWPRNDEGQLLDPSCLAFFSAEYQQNAVRKLELGFGVFGVCLGPKLDPNG